MQNELEQHEFLRYSRHLPILGIEGQRALKNARILCIGSGGLGCPILQYLTAAGIGTLGIVDGDSIELSNLQRQILFTEADIGERKAKVAAQKLKQLNQSVTLETYTEFLSDKNARQIIEQYDLVMDATDNYETRYLINAECRDLGKPMIFASIYQFEAQISVFNHNNGPCYQCLYPAPPPKALIPNCAQGGVLGVLPGIVGTLQATEAIKLMTNQGDTLSGKLLSIDLLTMQFKTYDIQKHPNCPEACEAVSTASNEPKPLETKQMTPILLAELLKNKSPIMLIDVRETYEREICHIGGTLIPLHQFHQHMDKLDPKAKTVIYCRSGMRSSDACEALIQAGFEDVHNLEGGILAWINDIDSNLTKY